MSEVLMMLALTLMIIVGLCIAVVVVLASLFFLAYIFPWNWLQRS